MTDRQINNRITKLQGIETQIKELEAQAEAILRFAQFPTKCTANDFKVWCFPFPGPHCGTV